MKLHVYECELRCACEGVCVYIGGYTGEEEGEWEWCGITHMCVHQQM